MSYNKWLDWNFWNQALTVSLGHRFSYDSVFYNQAHDVHPPLYYVMIHTICSFFPGQISKWFGIIPNIIFFVCAQIVIWIITKKLFSNKWMALLICAFYGFSWGTINNIVYIRMYAMLTMWALLSYLLHLKMIKSFSYKKYICILVISFLGIMTQYYFLIYGFFLSFFYVLILIMRKEYKFILFYILGFVVLAVLTVQFYPPIIDQILGKVGTQGQTAIHNMMESDFLHRISIFAHIISKDLFGGHIIWIASILMLIFLNKVFSYFGKISIIKNENNNSIKINIYIHSAQLETTIQMNYLNKCMVYSFLCALGYFCIIAKIAPFFDTRYLVIIHPLIIILFIYILDKFRYLYRISIKGFSIIISILLILFSMKMYHADNLFFYDKNYENINQVIVQENANLAFIVVTREKNWWPTIDETFTLSRVNKSYMIREDEMDCLPNILQDYLSTHSKVLLYRGYDCRINEEDFVKKINSEFLGADLRKLDTYGGEVYLLEIQTSYT